MTAIDQSTTPVADGVILSEGAASKVKALLGTGVTEYIQTVRQRALAVYSIIFIILITSGVIFISGLL